jgi:hypothetical protein
VALLPSVVPGVYRRPAPRRPSPPRVRTDVVGFVGVAGPNRLHEAVRLDDWRDYEARYLRTGTGVVIDPPLGGRLAGAVRAFFTNGGARCWVVNVAEWVNDPASPGATIDTRELLARLLGLLPTGPVPTDTAGAPLQRWGLERLLDEPEVAIVAIPDLHAERVVVQERTARGLPPRRAAGVPGPCAATGPVGTAAPPLYARAPLFDTDLETVPAQRVLLERCDRARQRVFALVCPPGQSSSADVERWRSRVGPWQSAAAYWPWVLAQETPGGEVRSVPPLGHVAGVYARRDLARGPETAPANERVEGVVGLETPVDDLVQTRLYPLGINPLRVFPGRGIEVWGARTLGYDDTTPSAPMGFVNVRRGLTAVERFAETIGQAIVFEPNSPMVWMRLTQSLTGYLQRLFEGGVLLGTSPGEAFFVRCDTALNPPESLAEGRLVCEVGVAIAVPAEFIVFRLGRREGVVEIEER